MQQSDTPAMQELSQCPFWVLWEPVPSKVPGKKPAKVPKSVSRDNIDITLKKNWKQYDFLACTSINLSWPGGLGFVLDKSNPYCGIDIDNCVDPKTKEIQPHAKKAIKHFDSYWEYSWSGTGIHILIKARLEGKGIRSQGTYEIYDHERYFVTTGNWGEGPDSIQSRQYELDSYLKEYFTDKVETEKPKEWKGVGDFVFDRDAEPPKDKFDALADNNKKFKKTWHKALNENELDDRTPSGYDFQIVIMTLQAGWRPQEVYNTVIAFRRKWCVGDEKAFMKIAPKDAGGRDDYFVNTFNKAKSLVDKNQDPTFFNIEKAVAEGSDSALQRFNEITKLNLEGIVQRGLPSTYLVLIKGEKIPIGTAKDLHSAHHFGTVLYDYTGRLLEPRVKKRWHELCQLIHKFAIKDMSNEFKKNFQSLELVRHYLEKRPPATGSDWPDAAVGRQPFIKDFSVYINKENFKNHLAYQLDIRMGMNEVSCMLDEAGFKNKTISITTGKNKTTQRGCWGIDVRIMSNDYYFSGNGASGNGEDDMAGGTGDKGGEQVREQEHNDLQSNESGGS